MLLSIQTVGRGNQARTLTSFFRLLKNIIILLKQGRDHGQDRVWEGFFKLQS